MYSRCRQRSLSTLHDIKEPMVEKMEDVSKELLLGNRRWNNVSTLYSEPMVDKADLSEKNTRRDNVSLDLAPLCSSRNSFWGKDAGTLHSEPTVDLSQKNDVSTWRHFAPQLPGCGALLFPTVPPSLPPSSHRWRLLRPSSFSSQLSSS